ncbi:MAG: hypothetical protein IKT17_10130 [Lachnospiraceae bacterium]|nr:hypothetical protein [Lachnospiraceae bacterium]
MKNTDMDWHKDMKTLRHHPFTLIMTALILAGFIGYIFGVDGEFSESENRYLAKRPAFSIRALADGSFMEQFELYTKEQLPLRDILIKLKAFTGGVMLKNENNGIVLGRDGYLFEKLVSTGEQLDKNKAAIEAFAGQAGRDIYVCIVPNSYEILKDRVPAGFPGISQEAYINDLYAGLEDNDNVSTVDLYGILTEHSDEYIYYRTDHHWTTRGAYYGYLGLCEDMGLDPVTLNDLSSKGEEVSGFCGTYYSKYKGMGAMPDILTYYDIPVRHFEAGGTVYDSMYDLEKLKIYDKYAMFMHGNEGISIIESEDDGRDKRDELILFKDSYSNCLIPFLTYDYDRIIVVDLRYYADSVKGLIGEHSGADVLLLYNFMHFNEDNHFYRLTG